MKLILWLLCITAQLTPQHVKSTVDSDTFALYTFDGLANEERVRVLGVQSAERPICPKVDGRSACPNLNAPVSAADSAYVAAFIRWEMARLFTALWLAPAPFTIQACRRDSFGRYLAWVNRGTDSLHVAIIAAGYGVRSP